MNDSECQEAVFALLADPATHDGAAVKRIDTHAAVDLGRERQIDPKLRLAGALALREGAPRA